VVAQKKKKRKKKFYLTPAPLRFARIDQLTLCVSVEGKGTAEKSWY
jgi:hypothetical protein